MIGRGDILKSKLMAKLLILLGVFCLMAYLGLYHQPFYPVSWQDEGFVLQGAMNLARYGKYAMLSSEGFRILDQPLVANGPGVVLPITASFLVFGAGLIQARLVIWLFMIWATAMFYILAHRLTGKAAAWISTIILLSATTEGFIYYGRIAMGNMPALAFLLTGFVFLLDWIVLQKYRYAVVAGVFFGLSVVTKSQTALIIPALVLAAIIDAWYYRKAKPSGYITIIAVVSACMLVWYFAQFLIVGQERFTQHLAAIRSSSQVTIFVPSLERIPRNGWQFLISGMPIYCLPGLIWAGWSLRHKTIESALRLPFVLLAGLWLGWYEFFSIGWHRYFFDPAVIGTLFSGGLVMEALEAVRTARHAPDRKRLLIGFAALGLIGVFGIAAALGLWENIRRITASPNTALQDFAEYLVQNVPAEAVIESWEWQIDPLVSLTFHHPTNDWVDWMTIWMTFGEAPDQTYTFAGYKPQYLIEGPFSTDSGIYQEELRSGSYELVYSNHPYYLYSSKNR